jgi:hypothetical protein
MSTYAPFANYLAARKANTASLSFDRIERILGRPLPPSARRHRAWWANSSVPTTHYWSALWAEVGWECTGCNLERETVVFQRTDVVYDFGSSEAREGYARDATILIKARSTKLAARRKAMDEYTCQACFLQLKVNNSFVAEVHHTNPLGMTGETVTSLKHLVTLCPTCHTVAHMRSRPYSVNEIRRLRSTEADG